MDAVKGYASYLDNGLATPVPPERDQHCVVQASHPAPAHRMDNLQVYAPAAAVDTPSAALPAGEVKPATETAPGKAKPGNPPPAKPAGKPPAKPPVKPNPKPPI